MKRLGVIASSLAVTVVVLVALGAFDWYVLGDGPLSNRAIRICAKDQYTPPSHSEPNSYYEHHRVLKAKLERRRDDAHAAAKSTCERAHRAGDLTFKGGIRGQG